VERVLAIELLVAAQALDARLSLLPGTAPGEGVAEAHRRIRAVVPRLEGDREPGPDIAAATTLVRTGALAELVTGGGSRGGRRGGGGAGWAPGAAAECRGAGAMQPRHGSVTG